MPPLLLLIASLLPADKATPDAPMPMKIGSDNYQFTADEFGPVPASTGKFQQGQPVSFRADGIDIFRRGDVLVCLDAGKWQRTRTGTLARRQRPRERHRSPIRLQGSLSD